MRLIKPFLPPSIRKRLRQKIYKFISTTIELYSQIEIYERFSKSTVAHPSVILLPEAKIDNLSNDPSSVSIGEKSVIRGHLFVYPHGGRIEIGKNCHIGENTRIWSADSVKICNRVYISYNVNIHDTNTHSINPELRHAHCTTILTSGHPKANNFDIQSQAIYIEDDVWIGFNSTILKGVTIGRGSIVAACSVVTKSVPPFVIVAGNPARIVKAVECVQD